MADTCVVCGVNPPAPADDACEECHDFIAATWILATAMASHHTFAAECLEAVKA